ncbi:MAG: DUF2628 domain-containing protein [Devosia sp.]
MAIFTVHENPKWDEKKRLERTRFVRDGFAWLAFLFGPLWLLYHRMWLVFVGLMVVSLALVMAMATFVDESAGPFAIFALQFWIGFEGRSLRRWSLARKGWTLMAVVEAKRKINAERRYFTAYFDGTLDGGPITGTLGGLPGSPGSPNSARPQGYGPWGSSSQPVMGLFPEGTR